MLTFKLCCFYALGSLCSHSQYLCSCAQQVYVFLLWSLSGNYQYITNNYFSSSLTCTLNCVCFTLFVCLCVSRAHTVIQTSSQWAVLWGLDAVLEPLLEVKYVQKCIFLVFFFNSFLKRIYICFSVKCLNRSYKSDKKCNM